MKFNENLKYLRKKDGLTQEELAEKLNVSRQSVTKWESGQALPDIEKIKEISYIFSVSVDSLIGDVESRTTNKIKKKINDIGWFVFGFFVLAIGVIISVSTFISGSFKNTDVTITTTIIMVIIACLTFVARLKVYLKENNNYILNMKDNKEGKKERILYIIKKYIFTLIVLIIFSLIIKLPLVLEGVDVFIKSTIQLILRGAVLTVVLACIKYKRIEKTVKKLNKTE